MAEMPFERVLAAIDRLTERQRGRLGRELARTSDERLVLATLNGPAFRSPACPHCAGRRLQRWGQASGLQRYRCTACLRTCNPLTGTLLARLRRRDLWLGHAEAMGESASLRVAARRLPACAWRRAACQPARGRAPPGCPPSHHLSLATSLARAPGSAPGAAFERDRRDGCRAVPCDGRELADRAPGGDRGGQTCPITGAAAAAAGACADRLRPPGQSGR